jgi:hypothetical protein
MLGSGNGTVKPSAKLFDYTYHCSAWRRQKETDSRKAGRSCRGNLIGTIDGYSSDRQDRNANRANNLSQTVRAKKLLTNWFRRSWKYGARDQIIGSSSFTGRFRSVVHRSTNDKSGRDDRTRRASNNRIGPQVDATRTARNSDIQSIVDDNACWRAFRDLDDGCHQIDERGRLETAFANLDHVDPRVHCLPGQLYEPLTTGVAIIGSDQTSTVGHEAQHGPFRSEITSHRDARDQRKSRPDRRGRRGG